MVDYSRSLKASASAPRLCRKFPQPSGAQLLRLWQNLRALCRGTLAVPAADGRPALPLRQSAQVLSAKLRGGPAVLCDGHKASAIRTVKAWGNFPHAEGHGRGTSGRPSARQTARRVRRALWWRHGLAAAFSRRPGARPDERVRTASLGRSER